MIYLTGESGYIGSHIWVDLLSQKFDVLGLDNFSNSSLKVLDRIKEISCAFIKFKKGDLRNDSLLSYIFESYEITKVIHFVGLKSVGGNL